MNSHLALLGDTPVITASAPHFSWPPITDGTTKAVFTQLHESISIYDRSGVVAELEDALCDYFEVQHAVLTSSGTAALHSTYVASFIEPGDEVIVPAYTFLATVTPLLHLGAVPILADCDDTGNVSVMMWPPGSPRRRRPS
ncbi:MAG: aminotransferase class I/II-fold pyridoxal phosphate-dependent enzyme [Pseudonocardiaceae bacterium]